MGSGGGLMNAREETAEATTAEAMKVCFGYDGDGDVNTVFTMGRGRCVRAVSTVYSV